MNVIEGLYYTKDHEWVKVEDGKAYIGITEFAAESMGDIVYVELPELDETIDAHEQCGVIESVKAAADIFMPITGTIVEVNEELEDSPELINEDPYGAHIFVIEDIDSDGLDGLMNASDYKTFCED